MRLFLKSEISNSAQIRDADKAASRSASPPSSVLGGSAPLRPTARADVSRAARRSGPFAQPSSFRPTAATHELDRVFPVNVPGQAELRQHHRFTSLGIPLVAVLGPFDFIFTTVSGPCQERFYVCGLITGARAVYPQLSLRV